MRAAEIGIPVVSARAPPARCHAAAVEGHRDVRGEPGREPVGAAGYRVGLVDHGRQPRQPGPEHCGRTRIAAHADDDVRALRPDHGTGLVRRAQQSRGQQVPLRAQRRVEGDHVDGVQAVVGPRDQLGLQAPLGPDERDHGAGHGRAQRLGEGQTRVDVAAGAARTDDDGECRRCVSSGHGRTLAVRSKKVLRGSGLRLWQALAHERTADSGGGRRARGAGGSRGRAGRRGIRGAGRRGRAGGADAGGGLGAGRRRARRDDAGARRARGVPCGCARWATVRPYSY